MNSHCPCNRLARRSILPICVMLHATGGFGQVTVREESISIPTYQIGQPWQDAYLNVYALRCLEYVKRSQYGKALGETEAALAYPVGLNLRPRHAQFDYLAGIIYQKMGERAKAEALFRGAIAVKVEGGGAEREEEYYQGLAWRELGGADEARKQFLELLEESPKCEEGGLSGNGRGDAQAATSHYLAGLAREGLGEREKARAEFDEALRINPGYIWSRVHLDSP